MNRCQSIRFQRAGGLLAGLLALSGCSSFRTEMGRPLPGKAPVFVEGQTTAAAVMREMGAPDAVSRLPQGMAFLYEYSRMDEFQLGFSVDFSLLRYLKIVHAFNDLDEEVFLLTFDDHGVLQSMGSKQWSENLGGGNAVQIVVAAVSLSDISEILRPADAHDWGKMLLQSPPETLNTAQSLRTGQHGMELRIAPQYAGQETLEMTKPKTEKEKRKIKKDYQNQ